LKKLSVGALSQQLPLRLIEQRMPYEFRLRWKSWLAYWADSTGRRNISRLEVLNGTTTGMGLGTNGRPVMRSPGRPGVNQLDSKRAFWKCIAQGMETEAAALACNVSQPLGPRWFREAGGMAPIDLAPHSGRYLSFSEREEIALLWAQDCSVREISRRLERSPSTISRELRRNAATRGGTLVYRATVAQWKAERAAERPKASKLARERPVEDICAGSPGWNGH
jgi:DNA-binding CsgD family transcriptional regulator